jgi:hypothetical protein
MRKVQLDEAVGYWPFDKGHAGCDNPGEDWGLARRPELATLWNGLGLV